MSNNETNYHKKLATSLRKQSPFQQKILEMFELEHGLSERSPINYRTLE